MRETGALDTTKRLSKFSFVQMQCNTNTLFTVENAGSIRYTIT